jgi:hypothetical protein
MYSEEVLLLMIVLSFTLIAIIYYSMDAGEGIEDIFNRILFSCIIYGMILSLICIGGIIKPKIIPKIYRDEFVKINCRIQDKINEIW